MAAEELKLSSNLDAEFNPRIEILAGHPDNYSKFDETLRKNGFNSALLGAPPENWIESAQPGTIFFVSWNLKTADPIAIARDLEAKGFVCIVFAEDQGFDTAAKLSSARMPQTLQHPYTEKNFLMAVQTIVKKRKIQHEKDLRKLSHIERRKGLADAAAAAPTPSKPSDRAPAIIIQKGIRAVGPRTRHFAGDGYVRGYSKFEKGRRAQSLSEMQKGLKTAQFWAIQEGEDSHAMSSSAKSAESSGSIRVSSSSMPGIGSVTGTGESKPISSSTGTGSAGAMSATQSSYQTNPKMDVGGGKGTEFVAIRKVIKGGDVPPPPKKEQQVPESVAPKPPPAEIEAQQKKAKREGEVLVGYSKEDLKKDGATQWVQGSGAEPSDASHDTKPSGGLTESFANELTAIGPIKVPTWALIAALSLGILFCLFLVYEMLFQR